MITKKLLFFAVGLFVITGGIWGSATPALSETLNCKGEGTTVSLKMVNIQGNYIGVSETDQTYICDNGETFTEKAYTLWDFIGKEIFVQCYSIITFKDNSIIISKYKFTMIADPKGQSEWIWDGTADIIRGTMRFNGIKGSIYFKGKQDASRVRLESTMTYTLTTK